MKKILIVNMGTPPEEMQAKHGLYSDWFLEGLESVKDSVHFETMDVNKTNRDQIEAADAVMLTGAHEGVYDRLSWRGQFDPLLLKYIESGRQVLGICFSHQYLCELMGGKAEYRPESEEEGNITVSLTNEGLIDPLFFEIEKEANFLAAHSDMVVKPSPDAVHLAGNEHVPYQSFRYGTNVRSCQFHPEMSEIISRSIIAQTDAAEEDKAVWLESLNKPHSGATVMQNFINLVKNAG